MRKGRTWHLKLLHTLNPYFSIKYPHTKWICPVSAGLSFYFHSKRYVQNCFEFTLCPEGGIGQVGTSESVLQQCGLWIHIKLKVKMSSSDVLLVLVMKINVITVAVLWMWKCRLLSSLHSYHWVMWFCLALAMIWLDSRSWWWSCIYWHEVATDLDIPPCSRPPLGG